MFKRGIMKKIYNSILIIAIFLGMGNVSIYNANEVDGAKSEPNSEQDQQNNSTEENDVVITGAEAALLKVNTDFDAMSGVQVNGTDWNDLNSTQANISNNVNITTPGVYNVTYTFEDINVATRTIYVIDNVITEDLVENENELLTLFGLTSEVAVVVKTSSPINEMNDGNYEVTFKLNNEDKEVTVLLTINKSSSRGNVESSTCVVENDESYKEITINNVTSERTYYAGNKCTGNRIRHYKYYDSGKIKEKYTYYYTGAYSYVKSEYNESGKITKTTRYYRSTGKANYVIEYHANQKMKKKTYYNTEAKIIRTEDYTDEGTLSICKIYDGKGFKTSEYRYHSNRKVKAKYTYYKTGSYSYVRNDYDVEGRITHSTRYYRSGSKRNYQKEYYQNKKVKCIKNYNSKGQYTLIQVYASNGIRSDYKKYDGKGHKLSDYDYYTNGKVKKRSTYYQNGEKNQVVDYYTNGKIQKSYKAHMEKNNVVTGVTEKWYYSSGKLKKIDARTFPTYYSQYNANYKKYSCPAYNGNMYEHGCIMNSMAMFYSVYNDDELTPIELYSQGYKCFFNVPSAYSRNGLDVDQVSVAGSKHNAFTSFYNTGGHVPNGKSRFTIKEAIVDYGMPVQLMMRNNSHIAYNFPGHSIMPYRYVYENGKEKIYAKNPGAKGATVDLQAYMNGDYHEYGAKYYLINHAWVGNKK